MPHAAKLFAAVAGLALAGAFSVHADPAPAPAPAPAPGPVAKPQGYLPHDRVPDLMLILPAPPSDASDEGRADRAVFNATRALKDSPRWAMAARDADVSLANGPHAFDCALGVTLDAGKAPTLWRVLTGVRVDLSAAVGPAKDHYGRPRPMIGNDAPTCVARSEITGPAYPSGHATTGWSWAMVLAELAPDRSSQILARGRAYGESRVVCGAHFPTDITEGRTSAGAVMAAEHANAQFLADMAKAKEELAALRASGAPPSRDCAAEAALVATPVY